jgi:hypothetical protein
MFLHKKRILIIFIISLLSLTSYLSADPWLDQFIVYSDDGRTLEKFPRFHKGAFTIPETVVEIGDNAFAQCSSLTSIIIHDGVTKIGDGAFALCTSLTSIRIPDGVTRIGDNTFYRCFRLENIVLPASLEEIGYRAFHYCDSLQNIEIPLKVKNIGNYAFSNSALLSFVVKGENVHIGEGFIMDSSNLEYVDLRYISEIKESSFRDCPALKEVILPKSIDYTSLNISENAKITLFSDDGFSSGITSYESLFWVNSDGGLNVRDTAGLGGNKIDALPDGSPVIRLETDDTIITIDDREGQWTHIQSDSVDGWVFGGYLNTSNTRHKYGENRFIEHQPEDRDYTDQDLTPGMIEGKWDITHTNGKPEDASPLGSIRNENFLFPYTGSSTSSYTFQIDGSCEIDSNSTGTGIGTGKYTMRGSHVRCQYESEPDYCEAGKNWVDNYDILVLDQTHIQIVDRASIYWYICALDDNNIRDKLHHESIDSFAEYVRSMSYGGHTTFSHEETLLMKAVESHNPEAVEWVLNNLETDVNQKNLYGMTALHYAMFTALEKDDPQLNDCIKVLEILIKAGADINAIDDYRQTPLDYSLYDDEEYNRIYNSKLRCFLANAGGKSSRQKWARLMTRQDFVLY